MARHFRTKKSVSAKLLMLRRRREVAAALASFLIIVGVGIMLWVCKVLISSPDQTSFITYNPIEDQSQQQQERLESLAGGQAPAAPPVDIIVATDNSDLATIALDNSTDGLVADGSPLGGGLGGDGLGVGLGSGNGRGMGSKKKVESSFCGRFWDLKRNNSGNDSRIKEDNMAVLALESKFFNKGWSASDFSNFLESKEKLYATSFYMPNCMDQEAARAYDPTGKQKLSKSRWVAVYRAKVKAPKTGRFRFVGAGDSILAVRFDGKNVLACGFHDLQKNVWNGLHVGVTPGCVKGRDLYAYEGCEFWNDQFGGFAAGEPFDVKKGNWYEMQVLVSEIGGGMFGFCLLVDDMTEEGSKMTKDGKPLFQLFRTNFDAPEAKTFYESIRFAPDDEESKVNPPYDEDSMIWEAKPMEARGK